MPALPSVTSARLDELIETGATMPSSSKDMSRADYPTMVAWYAASTAWLERILRSGDAYTRQFGSSASGPHMSAARTGTANLRQVRADLEQGYLSRLSGLIAAAVEDAEPPAGSSVMRPIERGNPSPPCADPATPASHARDADERAASTARFILTG
jgi:hypothetical protein